MQGHTVSTCPLVQRPCYQCVTRCGQTTCTVCPVACMTCKLLGHTEDMQSCVIPKGREAKFVCEMHDTSAMRARLQVIIDVRELTPRQLKKKRARAKQFLIATGGDSGRESHVAPHVARSAIVDDAGLGGAAAQPRTRDAHAAVAAALDAGTSPGAARLAGALLSHKTSCHPSPQKKIGTPAQLREPTRTPLFYSRPVTRSPRRTPEGAKREEGGENAVMFLWGSLATGAPLSP